MTGRDTGLTEANGRGVRVFSELFSIVRARMNASTSYPAIANTTYTTVAFNQIDFDTKSLYNTSNGEFTAPVTGLYRVSCRYQINLAAFASEIEFNVSVNGTTQVRNLTALDAGIRSISVIGYVFVARGDKIVIRLRQNSGQATINTGTFSGDASDLVIELL